MEITELLQRVHKGDAEGLQTGDPARLQRVEEIGGLASAARGARSSA
jgi:hypothetical protein